MTRRPVDSHAHDAWYAQPILWLGAAIFVASMAGCVWLIAVSLHHDETPHHGASQVILGVPAAARSSPSPAR